MSRPRKTKIKSYSVAPSEVSFPSVAKKHLVQLSADPTNSDWLSLTFADVIAGTSTKRGMEIAGITMAFVLRKAPIDSLEEFFRRLVNMRRESDKEPCDKGRNWNYLKAYLDYLSETDGRNPTKPELTDFILARPEQYFNMPSIGDTKAWTRMREETGLDKLLTGRRRN